VYGSDSSNSLFWFVEFQRNGQPHFHFYANHYIEKGWLAVAWSSVVGSTNKQHLKAGTRIETIRDRTACLKYASKYASKNEQKIVPDLFKTEKGFRWWGIVGCRDIVSASIVLDDTEYGAFEAYNIIEIAEKQRNRVIFDDKGAKVWLIENKQFYKSIFKAFVHANKMLLQAEQAYQAQIYRERRC
jgi:hypothetical protein